MPATNTLAGENFIGVYGGYQFATKGSRLTAQEDLNYTGSFTAKHPATGSDILMDNSATFGARFGHYFDNGFGVELDGNYSQPNFKRQDVTISLTDGTTIGGTNTFTEDQLSAKFHMVSGGVNLLYRFDKFEKIKPYVGAGPAIYGLFINGTGDSCHIIAPASLVRGFCSGGTMVSGGVGLGFNLKAGFEVPITERLSFDTEYKFSYGKMNINWFRSFSDIKTDYQAHSITAGLRFKF